MKKIALTLLIAISMISCRQKVEKDTTELSLINTQIESLKQDISKIYSTFDTSSYNNFIKLTNIYDSVRKFAPTSGHKFDWKSRIKFAIHPFRFATDQELFTGAIDKLEIDNDFDLKIAINEFVLLTGIYKYINEEAPFIGTWKIFKTNSDSGYIDLYIGPILDSLNSSVSVGVWNKKKNYFDTLYKDNKNKCIIKITNGHYKIKILDNTCDIVALKIRDNDDGFLVYADSLK